ncbi:TetR/AcrR family transcriptional regulator [Nocardioides pacificus]
MSATPASQPAGQPAGQPARRGRRPGAPDTKAAILASARRLFAAQGHGGTTIRAVAADAGVDAALVHHYFRTKDDLFVAALELPMDPRVAMLPVIEGGPDGAGERIVRTVLGVWDDEANRLPLLAIIRGIGDPAGQRLVRDGFLRMVAGPVGLALAVDDPARRTALVASQLIGLLVLRYVMEQEPLASMPADLVVATYGPVLQGYLTGPLPS